MFGSGTAASGPSRTAGSSPSRLDGLRLDWPGGWLLVRASNTEPIVRLVGKDSPVNGTSSTVVRLMSDS